MKTYDRFTGLFWLILSVFVCIHSLRLGIGTVRHPGLGFMAFGTSLLLGLLSVILLLQAFFGEKSGGASPPLAGKLWRKVFFVLIALLVYAVILRPIGYLISTLLLMIFLFWVVKGQKWWLVLIYAVLTTLITYYVFSVLLKGQYPEGLLGF
jgi:putative tricarboxylic transport membrane protein